MPVQVLVADDDQSIRAVLSQALREWNFDVTAMGTGKELLDCVSEGTGQVVVLDVLLPDTDGLELVPQLKKIRPDLPVIIISAQNNALTALRAGNREVFDYLPKPFDLDLLRNAIERALPEKTSPQSTGESQPLPLIGRSPAMQVVYKALSRLVSTEVIVLIQGESGTGKELAARALHDFSKRKGKPFIAINMGAIPKDLIESELFGFDKGSFTGAVEAKRGKFSLANGGTLFLDEIGDMPLEAQTRLLRVLQSGEFTPIGSQRVQRSDCRIVAATHRNLKSLVKQGSFREDLYYRLAVVPIDLPPLRQRKEDIPDLVLHFVSRIAAEQGIAVKQFTPLALAELSKHSWPGNVRELENMIRRLMIFVPDRHIDAFHVAQHAGNTSPSSLGDAVSTHVQAYFEHHDESVPPAGLYDLILREVERPLLSLTLKASKGNQIKAAAMLGINRNTLRKKLRDLGLSIR